MPTAPNHTRPSSFNVKPRRASARRLVAQALACLLLWQTIMPPALASPARDFRVPTAFGVLPGRAEAVARRAAAAGTGLAGAFLGFLSAAGATPAEESWGVVLTPLVTGFGGHVGVDHHAPSRKLVLSANALTGQPHNFELLSADAGRAAHSNVAGVEGEILIATARDDDGKGASRGGFNAGEMFAGAGATGALMRVSADGASVRNPWVNLPGEGGQATGLHVDRVGSFGGDLLVTTAGGGLWRVSSSGAASLVANLGTRLAGVTSVPDDVLKYGPWAGKALVGAKEQAGVYAVDAQGGSAFYQFGISPQDIDIVTPHENLFAADTAGETLWGAPAAAFSSIIGDVLVTQESPGTLSRVRWDGSGFVVSRLGEVARLKQVTFSPAGAGEVTGVNQVYDKIAVVRHAPTVYSGRVEGALWQLTGEDVTLGGTDVITSDLLLPGSPSVSTNDSASFKGVIEGFESPQPTGYTVTLDGNASLRHVVTRTNPIELQAVAAPPAPAGTRVLSLSRAGEAVGDPATLRDLSLSGKAGAVALPPGTYGRLSAGGHTAFILGAANSTEPSTYNLEELTLGGGSQLRLAGPVVLKVKNAVSLAGSSAGVADDPRRLALQVAAGGVSLSGGATLYAVVRAPSGAVTINGRARLRGTASCDRLSISGGGVLQITESDLPPPPVNRPPAVDAGADEVITLPSDTVSLNPTVSDDGLPQSDALVVTWSKASGPGPVAFADARAATTTAAFAEPGDYVLRLTASDGQLLSSDTKTVNVIPRNQPPVVVAGQDQTIELPNVATVSADVSDDALPRGSTVTVTWSKVSGPGEVAFADPHSATTTASFAEPGTYKLRLSASDTELDASGGLITVVVHPENRPPSADAGADQPATFEANLIQNPGNEEELVGGAIKGWTVVGDAPWTQGPVGGDALPVSREGDRFFRAGDAASAELRQDVDVSTLRAATANGGQRFEFKAHVRSRDEAPADETRVVVEYRDAANAVVLDSFDSGALSGPDWQLVEDTRPAPPGTAWIRVRLVGARAGGASNDTPNDAYFDALSLRALSAAGATLSGTLGDDGVPEGVTPTATWSKVSGPGSVLFDDAGAPTTAATFGAPGTYVLRLTASDSKYGDDDETVVNVGAANRPPSVEAGDARSIGVSDAADLNGAAGDDGLPAAGALAVRWSKAAGPGDVTFGNAEAAATSARFAAPGDYVLVLSATDSQFTFRDEVKVKVTPENQAPTVSAGPDQNVTLPGAATLNGTAGDDGHPEGGSLTTLWSVVGGPGPVTFDAANSAATTARFGAAGTYVLRLTANDSKLTSFSDVTVVVGDANRAPAVSAGPDLEITLPAAASLAGVVTDDGLPANAPLAITWSKVSGPGGVSFADPNAPATAAAFDAPGPYTLQLTAADSELTQSDTVNVLVHAPSHPPAADFTTLDAAGSASLAVVAASGSATNLGPERMLDDSTLTAWQSGPGSTNQWVKFRVTDGGARLFDRVRLHAFSGGAPTSALKNFVVQVSDATDADADFRTVFADGTLLNNGQTQEFVFPGGPTRARFVRLLALNNYGHPSFISVSLFRLVPVATADSIISLPGRTNAALGESPAQLSNGAEVVRYSSRAVNTLPSYPLDYGANQGDWKTATLADEYLVLRLAGGRLHTLDGVKLISASDGFAVSGVRNFEVWVSATTADDTAFTKVLDGVTSANNTADVQRFMFPGGPAEARYVKLVLLTASQPAGRSLLGVALFDVIARDAAGLVAASGAAAPSGLAEAAFDGDERTVWTSPNGAVLDQWLTARLSGGSRKVYGVRISPDNAVTSKQGPKEFLVRASNTTADDAAFTTVFEGTLTNALAAQEFQFAQLVEARYVQFYWKNSYGTTRISVKELEVLAAPEQGSALLGFSSREGEPSAAENALDIDTNTLPWLTAKDKTAEQYLKLMLPRAELWAVDHVALQPGFASGRSFPLANMSPKEFAVQVSDTDAADASFRTVFEGTLVNAERLQHFYFPPAAARYVRLVLRNNYGAQQTGLHAFHVFSPEQGSTQARFLDRSADADGRVVSYAWDFGDGATSSERDPAHAFAAPGTYTVRLTVTDDSGLASTRERQYRAAPPLRADFHASPQGEREGQTIFFRDALSYLPGPNVQRRWDFGDGTTLTSLNPEVSCTFKNSGTYRVRLTVGDPNGVVYTGTRDVLIENVAPEVVIQPGKVVLWGEPWTNAPTVTDPSPADLAGYRLDWDFGDGQTHTCASCTNATGGATHAFALPGTYTVGVTVTDRDGGADSDSTTYTVNKRPVRFALNATQEGGPGGPVRLRALMTDGHDGRALAGRPLVFSLAGRTAAATTDAAGAAEVIVPVAEGTAVEMASVASPEDDLYLGGGGVTTAPVDHSIPRACGGDNRGTDFWLMFTPNMPTSFQSGPQELTLLIASDAATTGTVSAPGLGFSAPFNVAANSVALVKLPAAAQVTALDKVEGKGVRVTSGHPVAVYGQNYLRATTESFAGLPTDVLGTQYLVMGYENTIEPPFDGMVVSDYSTQFGVVATADDTAVTITPTAAVGPHPAGVPFTVSLDAGQTYLLRNYQFVPRGDLTGSLVVSDKPVAVFAGHQIADVPFGKSAGNHLVEQLPPVANWGKRFAVVPFAARPNRLNYHFVDSLRLLASADGTNVYVNEQRVATLDRGQSHELTFDAPAHVVADRPVLVAQYTSGRTGINPGNASQNEDGDPLMIIVPPLDQFVGGYTVSTPQATNVTPANAFHKNYVNVVVPAAAASTVKLDGVAVPAGQFAPIGISGFVGGTVTLTPGTHNLSAALPFGALVYGYGEFDAYGHAAGVCLRPEPDGNLLTLAPPVAAGTVGAQGCATATLTDRNHVPLTDRAVNFTVAGANAAGGATTTDAAGQAQFCYAGVNAGQDTITAAYGAAAANASRRWHPDGPNQPPAVSAGLGQRVVLPHAAELAGTAEDDGLPVGSTLAVAWSKVSGPGQVAFTFPNLARTPVTFDAAGTYVLRLTASDSEFTTHGDVTVTVTPANQPPAVSAGADQTITLPAGAGLSGSATDDGLPAGGVLTVAWSKVSGPGGVAFGNPTQLNTDATFDAEGTYVLRLTADDSESSATGDVTVTVKPAPPNRPPVVDAGPDKTAALGANLVANGGAEEPPAEGNIVGWTEAAGDSWAQAPAGADGFPAPRRGRTYFYAGGAAAAELVQEVDLSPFAAGIAAGTQQFELKAFVRSREEAAPDAARVIVEYRDATNTHVIATLDSGAITSTAGWHLTEDVRPAPAGTVWARIRLVAARNAGETNDAFFDEVSLRAVGAAAVRLAGAATDDGLPAGSRLAGAWSKVSGPGDVSFGDASDPTGGAAFSRPGTYVLRLTATDSELTASDDVTVTVAEANLAPTADAGPDQTVTLPDGVNLNGSLADDGRPAGVSVSARWSKLSGPGAVTFGDAAQATTTASFDDAGTYVLRLTADDGEYGADDDVVVTVKPEPVNRPPSVSAGPTQTVELPTDTVTLNGSVIDDGLPRGGALTPRWEAVSGPGAVTFGDPAQAVTTATFGAAGTYELRLTASDSLLSTYSNVTVVVRPANRAPEVSAGADQSTPLNVPAQLAGSVTDDGLPEGGALAVAWSKSSGPGSVTFGDATAPVTPATFSETGTYVLRLTAGDSALSNFDDVTVTVNVPAEPPTVELGSLTEGEEITAPREIVGTVSGGAWRLEYALVEDETAPVQTWRAFASGTTAVAGGVLGTFDPTVLLNGTYAVRLVSTDEYGRTAAASTSVVVSRQMKVGNFTVTFRDLSVEAAGIPVEVTRTYDSRDKRRGDFGVGWTMGLASARVQKNVPVGAHWYETVTPGLLPRYCLESTRPQIVTVTFGDGRVYRFRAAPARTCQQVQPFQTVQMTFVPMPGTRAALEPLNGGSILVAGSAPGPVELINTEDPSAYYYNPTRFRLTTEDGTSFVINQRAGVESVSTPAGETLTLTRDGLSHSAGASVAFVRDAEGRIGEVRDQLNRSRFYTYYPAGDLETYRDAEGNTTRFFYTGDHLLTAVEVTGADGSSVFKPIRNEYDAAGRLLRQFDADDEEIKYEHDVAARREVIRDRLDHPTTYEYDERGNVLHTKDAEGNETWRTYNADDQVLTERTAEGETVNTYDADGNLRETKDPYGNVTRYEYNALKRVTLITAPPGRVTRNDYDERTGRLLRTVDPEGNETVYDYEPLGSNLRSMTVVAREDPTRPRVTRYEYDQLGRVRQETDPLGRVTTYTYDANNNRTSQTATRTKADGTTEQLTTSFEYDRQNRPVKTTYPDNTFTTATYNALGKQSATTDQLRRETRYEYDAQGRPWKTVYPDGKFDEARHDAEGRRTLGIDRAGRPTAYRYDRAGRLVETLRPDGGRTTTTYDAVGRVLAESRWLDETTKHTTTRRYEADGRLRVVYATDALGNVTRQVFDEAGNLWKVTDAKSRTTVFAYDRNNRRVKTTYHDNTFETTAYDGFGQVRSKTDQANRTTRFEYDAAGRLVKVINAENKETTYGYDEAGNQTSQTDANLHTTRYEYDKLGRRTRRTLPAGMSELYEYDAAGLMRSRRDFNGRTTSYEYDSMNRLVKKTPDASFDQPAVTFTYTAAGRRLTMTDATGLTTYDYDARDRLKSKATPRGTLTYTYDRLGNLKTVRSSNAEGVSVDYDYDELSRLSAVTDNRLAENRVTAYTYDEVGNLESHTYGNGVKSLYVYNSLNRLTGLTVSRAASTVNSYAYVLGPAGTRESVTEADGRHVSYAYDSLYRLTGETVTNDPRGIDGAVGYVYDDAGNRLSRTSTLAGVAPQSFTYDANDRLTSDASDANGNTKQSGGVAYAYDWENRLSSAHDGAVNYAYDGDGNRVAKTVGGVTTHYLVDTNNLTGYAQVVEELRGGAVVRQYTYGGDLISQRQLVSGGRLTSYYGYDGHGSVRALTDESGAVTDTYTYDAFGTLVSATGATPNEYLYAGERFDPETGMYHLRARYMRPDTGRFWTMDGYEGNGFDPPSLHKYTYTHGDPLRQTDPSGNMMAMSRGEMLVVVGLVVILAGAAAYCLAQAVGGVISAVSSYAHSSGVEAETATSTSAEVSSETTKDERRDDSEVFYRAMGEKEWARVRASGGRLAIKAGGSRGRELFVTQNRGYVAGLSLSDPDRFGVIVQFELAKGTRSALMAQGAIDGSIVDNMPGLAWMPFIDSGDPDKVHLKYERGALTYGLRRNTIDTFNNAITSFRQVGSKGNFF